MGLRITANDLHRRFKEMTSGGAQTQAGRHRLAGYMVSVVTLRAFATECALKALAAKSRRSYLPTHDLLVLFDFLDGAVKDSMEQALRGGATTMRSTMECHRRDFVEWRYPAAKVVSANSEDLEPALTVCVDVFESDVPVVEAELGESP